jgi:NitT/TauT family transport system ATP-binding protein
MMGDARQPPSPVKQAGDRDAGSPVFSCEALSISFGAGSARRVVLDSINLEVHAGHFVSILGPSGTGKTTLLRALGGLQTPDTPGSVRHRGVPINGSVPDDVMFVFQNYERSLLPWRSVGRNVALGIESRLAKPERQERIDAALSAVNLLDRKHDYPWQLSGGMQQRVQIARALAMRPSVLLMDEPFGALDAFTKSAMQDELMRLHQSQQITVIFVTHDVDEAVYLSDRIVVLAGIPARVSREIVSTVPRPRDQLTTKERPDYLEHRRETLIAIGGAH